MKVVVLNLGGVCLFSKDWMSRTSDKHIHSNFHILYFVHGNTFCRSQNNRITRQKRSQ